MGEGNSPGRPPDKSDEEIVATVRGLIEATDSPAIERKVIQEELGYSEQAIRERLRSLVDDGKIGRYDASGAHIFWVSDNQEMGGEADSPEIITDIASIDPDDISTEKAREFALANFQTTNRRQSTLAPMMLVTRSFVGEWSYSLLE